MTTALQTGEPTGLTLVPAMTTKDILDRVERIREIQSKVMQEGMDYGRIQGCGEKPTLLKAGAETLLMAFEMAALPDQTTIEDLGDTDEVRYRVITPIVHVPTGRIVGNGVGECSSNEEKYRWRAAVSEAEYDATDPERRRIKYYRDGGTKQQVRTNKADVANTVLKMGKKRSMVDGALTVTAASRIFTQDVEDFPEEMRGEGHESAPAKTKIDFKPDTLYEGTLKSYVAPISKPKGQTGSKPQKLVIDVEGNELTIGGFAAPIAHAQIPPMVGKRVQVKYAQQGNYTNLTHLALAPEKAAEEPEMTPEEIVAQATIDLGACKTADEIDELIARMWDNQQILAMPEKFREEIKGVYDMKRKKLAGK